MQLFTGKEYLKIDIANNFGLDKWTWNKRLQWFDKNQHNLRDLVKQADEPALFFAGIQAWEAAMARIPSGYAPSLDATSSGLQILAAITGDRSAASLCNVINHFDENAETERRDGYTLVYQAMVDKLGETAKIKRDEVKKAIMTSLYGSEGIPKEVFGDGELLRCFYETMRELAPAAWELNEAFLMMWNPTASSYSWVLPDNFHVVIKVMTTVKETVHFLNEPYEIVRKVNQPMKAGRSLSANTVHSLDAMVVREITRRCDHDPYRVIALKSLLQDLIGGFDPINKNHTSDDAVMVKTLWEHYLKCGFLSARIIDHLDISTVHLINPVVVLEMLNTLPPKSFKVIAIHDCFRCLPNYCNDLRKQYNLQLHLLGKSTILSYLLYQLLGKEIKISKLDSTFNDLILEADYALS